MSRQGSSERSRFHRVALDPIVNGLNYCFDLPGAEVEDSRTRTDLRF